MFVTDFWVDSTNDFIDYMDNELLFVIKNSYETAINLNKACEGLDKNTKEAARLKEKARLLEFRKEIEGFRWNIAKLAYNSKRDRFMYNRGYILDNCLFSENTNCYHCGSISVSGGACVSHYDLRLYKALR